MKHIYLKPLKNGAHIRVIAPSLSMAIISKETINYALDVFHKLGFKVSFGKYVNEIDQFKSSSIESRIEDLHTAFSDNSVDGVLTIIGGYNSNQLLEHIDWSLIQQNPKVFCGYSDITILNNAIFSQTGLVTFYGPHFSTFGQKMLDQYQINYFLKAVSKNTSFQIEPAATWSNDKWYLDQDDRHFEVNGGYWIIQEGFAQGSIIGGHLGTFCLLHGTKYMPWLKNTILIIEEDAEMPNPSEFDRHLQSVLQQPNAQSITGVLIGRFERSYNMTLEILNEIIKTKKALYNKPVIANVDFGHTEPHCTLPIGGIAEIRAQDERATIRILNTKL